MPKTKAVESKDNEVIKKSTTKKTKNINTETVEKEEPNKLVAKTEKKVKITAKKAKEETISVGAADIKVSARAAYAATEVSQSIIGEDDIESTDGKKTRGRTPKKNKATTGIDQVIDAGAISVIDSGNSLPQDIEARRMRLKMLIGLGKERGYLTYAEINDHLPDDMLDAEQIEGIISMINDMGISVHDEAPDAETLLMSDAATTY